MFGPNALWWPADRERTFLKEMGNDVKSILDKAKQMWIFAVDQYLISLD